MKMGGKYLWLLVFLYLALWYGYVASCFSSRAVRGVLACGGCISVSENIAIDFCSPQLNETLFNEGSVDGLIWQSSQPPLMWQQLPPEIKKYVPFYNFIL